MSEKKLRSLVKESVKEVFDAEIMKLRVFVVPDISSVEQKDVEKRYKKPTKKSTKAYILQT